jgi:hypothetical protein
MCSGIPAAVGQPQPAQLQVRVRGPSVGPTFERRQHHRTQDVEAGIARSSQAPGDREAAIARGLAGQAGLIEPILGKLAAQRFNRESAAEIVELHGYVCRVLLPYTGETWQQSFVSKYLHVHCDIIPIYDSRGRSYRSLRGLGHRHTGARFAEIPAGVGALLP